MTCREIMTSDPVSCLPGDSSAHAARIMAEHDIGPVIVVSDTLDRQLVGIVTDRDLALNVLARERDPETTTVGEVMTKNPVTCRPEDNVERAIDLMERHQVRRIPVVDENGMVAGIIAQADVARSAPEQEVGELVEQISESSSAFRDITRPFRAGTSENYEGSRVLATIAATGASLCFGAALMYLMDPDRGRRRRALIRDKANSAYNTTGQIARRTGRDLSNRTKGFVAQARAYSRHESVPDEKLVARARSHMGRLVSHPHAVNISASGGRLILEGSILEGEDRKLLKCLQGMEGVSGIENRIHVYAREDSSRIPELQGGNERPGNSLDILRSNWSPATRLLAGAAGGGMALYGLTCDSAAGKIAGIVGLGLVARGVLNRDFAEMADLSRVRAALPISSGV